MKSTDAIHTYASEPQATSPSLITKILGLSSLAAIIAVHGLDLPGKLAETPYLGYAYIALMVGSALASILIIQNDKRGWRLGAALALGAIIAYTLSRTTGLPYAVDDIGNWGEPLGVISLVAEGVMVAVSYAALNRAEAEEEPLDTW